MKPTLSILSWCCLFMLYKRWFTAFQKTADPEIPSVTIQMKAIEHTFLWCCLLPPPCAKVVLTFESVDEILKCDHSNESY